MIRVKFLTEHLPSALRNINLISLVIYVLFFYPVLRGVFYVYSTENIRKTIASIINSIEFLLGLVISIYLTRKIFFENSFIVYRKVYEIIPKAFKAMLHGNSIITYVVRVPLLLGVFLLIFRLLVYHIFSSHLDKLADFLYDFFSPKDKVVKSLTGILLNLPKAFFRIFIFGLIISFSSYYFYDPQISKWLNSSNVYRHLYRTALEPVLNSSIKKKVPVIVSDLFKGNDENEIHIGKDEILTIAELISDTYNINSMIINKYFNEVTVDKAVKSNDEIDRTAREIVGMEENSRKKAYLIYEWITKNILYDYEKAENINNDIKEIVSGSIITFNTKKGVCFDYTCLYVSMCQAVGVKVRLVTGLGFSGVTWGEHAWNMIFCEEGQRWIDVDTTFGTIDNYFDKKDFSVDHKSSEVQGEWQ